MNYAAGNARRCMLFAASIVWCVTMGGEASAATAASVVEPPTERWTAYLELQVTADNVVWYLFSNAGELGTAATEECLDTEVASFVNMAKCAAEKGDPVALECTQTRTLQKKLLTRLDEQRVADPSIPNVALNINCVASRNVYEFDRVPLEQIAKAVGTKQLPATGVTIVNDRVLDDHFHSWTLQPCDLKKKGNLSCISAAQKFTATPGKGPYFTKAQRNDRLRSRAAVAESAHVDSVRTSQPITGAFGMKFGEKTQLAWKPADVNAMVDLPPSPPVVGGNLKGWVMFTPPEVPQVLASVSNIKFLALLKSGLLPIQIAAVGRAAGDCDELKRAIDQGLSEKYGKGTEPSLFTDGTNQIRTQCRLGRFAISFVDVPGYAAHNRELQADVDSVRQQTAAAAKEGL
jgi:hypothetical protein